MRNMEKLLVFISTATLVSACLITSAQAETIEHKVKAGETLQKISQEYFGTTRRWYKIWKQNKAQMEWPNSLEPGMILKFEGPQAHPEDVMHSDQASRACSCKSGERSPRCSRGQRGSKRPPNQFRFPNPNRLQ